MAERGRSGTTARRKSQNWAPGGDEGEGSSRASPTTASLVMSLLLLLLLEGVSRELDIIRGEMRVRETVSSSGSSCPRAFKLRAQTKVR
jgi:hypothetical protein